MTKYTIGNSGRMVMAAGLAMGLCASSAIAQDAPTEAGDIAQPTFHVTTDGPTGNAILEKIDFGGGLVFREFIYASEVSEFSHDGSAGSTRVVAAPNATNVSRTHRLGEADGQGGNVTQEDMDAFNGYVAEMLQNVNLNNFLDNNGSSPWFSFVVELEKPVKDNDPQNLDAVGEIIFFERGAQIANSFLLIEAIDEEGRVRGYPVLVSPDRPVHTTPETWVGVFRDNLQYAGWGQEMGAVSIDLTEMCVSEVSRLRVSRPHVGENGLTSAMLAGSPDLNPDFKLVFVQTYDVKLPGWYVGD